MEYWSEQVNCSYTSSENSTRCGTTMLMTFFASRAFFNFALDFEKRTNQMLILSFRIDRQMGCRGTVYFLEVVVSQGCLLTLIGSAIYLRRKPVLFHFLNVFFSHFGINAKLHSTKRSLSPTCVLRSYVNWLRSRYVLLAIDSLWIVVIFFTVKQLNTYRLVIVASN